VKIMNLHAESRNCRWPMGDGRWIAEGFEKFIIANWVPAACSVMVADAEPKRAAGSRGNRQAGCLPCTGG
jgi:hypothetical protein